MLFNVFKTGCKVEELQLGTIERIERARSFVWSWPGASRNWCALHLVLETAVHQPIAKLARYHNRGFIQ